ncbi:MAG: alpha/beta hydrolase [Pseudobacteriovorax sp.]|nr:alpha/beta hydrolase [Pseudobacteriovorax sp.]
MQLRCSIWLLITFKLFLFLFLFFGSQPRALAGTEETSCYLKDGQEAACQTFTFEDGVSIHVARIRHPATGTNSGKSPVLFLAGGPGQAAIEAFGAQAKRLRKMFRGRDLIFVDQLGVGQSHPINCKGVDLYGLPKTLETPELTKYMVRCGRELTASTKAPLILKGQYGTDGFVQLLEALRNKLKIKRWSLFGASYGTRVAVRYSIIYPNALDAVILEGIAGHRLRLFANLKDGFEPSLRAYERSREMQTPGASRTILQMFEALKAKAPINVKVNDPTTLEPLTIAMTTDLLVSAISTVLYDPNLTGNLPVMLQSALEGDYNPLVAPTLLSDFSVNVMMFYTVACSEDFPFVKKDEYYLPNQYEAIKTICDAWPQFPVEESFRSLVEIHVPTLLLGGDADPATPPQYPRQLVNYLKTSKYFEFKGYGHSVHYLPCARKLIQDFLKDPEKVATLDGECIGNSHAPGFFQNNWGPQ